MSETLFCTACGNAYPSATQFCPQCGTANLHAAMKHQQKTNTFATTQQPTFAPDNAGTLPSKNLPAKSRITAGILALLLGGIGVHKFYLKKVGLGVVYILFCWTFIPSIVAFVEGIIYLVQDDDSFSRAQRVAVQQTTW